MTAFRARRFLGGLYVAVAILALLVAVHGARGGFNWPPVRSDGEGYFAYLPALVIHRTLDFKVLAPHFGGDIPAWTGIFIDEATARATNVYPIGVGLLLAPFFLVAHFVTLVTVMGPADGYSLLYQLTPLAAGVVYYALGMHFLTQYLARFFSGVAIAWTAVLLTFGTSLFHYATYDAEFSHVYTFCFVALLVLLTPRFWLTGAPAVTVAVGATIGVLFLIRNYNLLYGLFFLLYPLGLRPSAARLYAARMKALAAAGVIAVAVTAPQFLVWKTTAGRWIVNSYIPLGLRFDFTSPHLAEVLFSAQKGVFAWSPLLVLGTGGLLLGVRQSTDRELRVAASLALAVLAGLAYLFASWQTWHFGGGFGHRGFVDAYPLFALGLAVVLRTTTRTILGRAIQTLALLSTLVTILLMYSYWVGKVPFGGPTAEMYVAALRSAPSRLIATVAVGAKDSTQTRRLGGTLLELTLSPDRSALRPGGESLWIEALVENTGRAYWLDAAPSHRGRVALGLQWFTADDVRSCSFRPETAISEDRLLLPATISPGQRVWIRGATQAPSAAGKYVLLVDIVSDGVTWFRDLGSVPRCYRFEVG